MNEKILALGMIGLIGLVIFIVGLCFFFETQIIDVSESDISYDEHDFYILDPDGNKITLGIDRGQILDLTKHSKVLVKFERLPSVLWYPGTDWYVAGVVKTPGDNNE